MVNILNQPKLFFYYKIRIGTKVENKFHIWCVSEVIRILITLLRLINLSTRKKKNWVSQFINQNSVIRILTKSATHQMCYSVIYFQTLVPIYSWLL